MTDEALPLNMILEQVGRDKGIEKQVLIEAIEAAILSAAKRTFGQDRDLEARFNEETGIVDLYQYLTVVDDTELAENEVSLESVRRAKLDADVGEELGFQIFYREEDEKKAKKQDKDFGTILGLTTYGRGFGRIAAQTAKQVIIQRVRDAERENIFNEYKDRKNEVIAGIVRRFERNNDIIVDLGRAEGIIPYREQTPRESYRLGDRVMAYVKEIDREARGPQIILSRTDQGLLRKLFEMEVPEIYEGIVKIVAAAREPGARSKIAVTSRDSDVDPVGACVGMRGARVQAVVQELRGEKIDIVPWDRDPARFVCNAIQPAEVSRVIIDEANGSMELVVPDDKLSLAIGRRGQNVRLASRLTSWRLDVISESKFEEREKRSIEALAHIDGIDEGLAKSMYKLGFRTVEEVAEADPSELAAIPGLGNAEFILRVQASAEAAMEQQRLGRIRSMSQSKEAISERDRMLLVPGVGERTLELLADAGYKTLNSLSGDVDVDKLAIATGLGIRKAKQIVQNVKQFRVNEEKVFEEMREQARLERELEADITSDGGLDSLSAGDWADVEGEPSDALDEEMNEGEDDAFEEDDEDEESDDADLDADEDSDNEDSEDEK